MTEKRINELLRLSGIDNKLKKIGEKIISEERISFEDGLYLYEKADLGYLGSLANLVKERKNGSKVYFNRNFHIEPTNICVYNCSFCSFVRKINQEGAWEYSQDEIVNICEKYKRKGITEVHIVGGVHPHRDLHYYGEMIQKVKNTLKGVHVKAFTAVEIEFMIKKAGMELSEGLKKLKEYGLDSMPGGGAEIFDEKIRAKVCGAKSKSDKWLKIHETAHKAEIPTNATMLYGHIENYNHRTDHLERLRNLQDKTAGFNTFIPLKYRKANNHLSHIGEVTTNEDLRNYAVARIYLDNFPHIKAYWPMIGIETTRLALSFGVDDIDGTIDDTTKIYSMAGVEDQSPVMNTEQLVNLIKKTNRTPIERDTLYNTIKEYK